MKYLGILKKDSCSHSSLQSLQSWKEFEISYDWIRDDITRLSQQTGLSEGQIYKWSWDQKKKSQASERLKRGKRVHLSEIFDELPATSELYSNKTAPVQELTHLSCKERIPLRLIDYDFYHIQKHYRCSLDILQARIGRGLSQDKCIEDFSI